MKARPGLCLALLLVAGPAGAEETAAAAASSSKPARALSVAEARQKLEAAKERLRVLQAERTQAASGGASEFKVPPPAKLPLPADPIRADAKLRSAVPTYRVAPSGAAPFAAPDLIGTRGDREKLIEELRAREAAEAQQRATPPPAR